MLRIPLTLALLLVAAGGSAELSEPRIEVQALLPGMAVLNIDGTKRTLKVGAVSPEGVKLVAADSKGATIELAGQTRQLGMGSGGALGGGFAAPTRNEIRLSADPSGMFHTSGSINGMPIDFLVDTGATTVAMNAQTAKSLGIDYRLKGRPSSVQTASGIEKVYAITLETVKVGTVTVRNVDAVVLESGFPTITLLGMSFLGQLEMVREGQALVLRNRF